MLNIMRKHAQSWLIKVALAIIVIVFVFYFGAGRMGQQSAKMAEVNGEPISAEAFRSVYTNLLRRVQAQYGDMLNNQILEALNLKQRALDQIINERLLLQEAQRLHFTVTPEELAENIGSMPYFQENGQFNRDLYFRMLRANRLEPAEFEDSQKRSLLSGKVQEFVTSNVVVSEQEAFEQFLYERDKVKVDFLTFSAQEQLPKVTLTEEDIKKYFEDNIKNFEIPAKVKIAYLSFPISDFTGKVTISEEEIKDEYQNNIEKYKQQKEVHARHILFKTNPDDSQQVREEKRKKAEEVLQLAKGGEDFAELAKKYSEGPTGPNGGDLGFFGKGRMVQPFEEVAFSMQPGEISDIVETQFGYHIIKVEEIKEARTKPFEEVKADIEKQLKETQAGDLAVAAAEDAYDQIMSGEKLESVANTLGIKVNESEYFAKNEQIKGLEANPQLAGVAFSLGVEEVAPVQENGRGYVIIKAVDKQEPRAAELDEVKAKVEEGAKLHKAEELARDEASKFLEILKNWKKLPEEAQQQKYEIKQSKAFMRNAPIPEIGYAPMITEAAFKLTEEKPYADEPILYQDTYYIIRLNEIIPASKEEFEKEKDSYMERLLSQKQAVVFSKWLESVKEKANIQVFEKI